MKPAVLLLTAVLLFQAVVLHAIPEFARRGVFFWRHCYARLSLDLEGSTHSASLP
jgi:DNA phosphorothioation-dependent restriction protein DptG